MPTDKETAVRALHFQANARDYPLVTLAGYEEWSQRRLDDGVSEALIAHLDARSMTLLPEEVAGVTDRDFDALLDDLRDSLAP
jgi:hypothetical protein